jgi:1-acyl-sn-glycerol-3-phosphate acyltransferase
MTSAVGAPSAPGPTLGSTPEPTSRRRSRWPSWAAAGTATDASIGRSDWWPSALGTRRLRLLASESTRTKRGGSVRPFPIGRFGPGYAMARLIATPLYRILWRVRVEGGERLPRRGPAILAANHVSFFDSVVLIMTVRRTLSFVGKIEYLDSWTTRRLLPAMGMIPVDRSDGRRAIAALKIAAGVLRAGGMFAIYPEGTRSPDGALQAGHTGVAYLSMSTGVPIVPAGIVGTNRIQPPGTRVPRPFRPVTVRFGRPIDPTIFAGSRRQRRRLITDEVMASIRSLSGAHPR